MIMKKPDAPNPLVEPSLFYNPPYERPLEDEFAWHLVKYLEPISGLEYQVRVETPCAHVWIDFVVAHNKRRFGFEIGGLDAEDGTTDTELVYRDTLVIGSGSLDVLYRFRGNDLLHRLHDCLFIASQWDADLFSRIGKTNLHSLASPEARAARPHPQDSCITVDLVELCGKEDDGFIYPGPDAPTSIVVRRFARSNPGAWLRLYDEALVHYSTPASLPLLPASLTQ